MRRPGGVGRRRSALRRLAASLGVATLLAAGAVAAAPAPDEARGRIPELFDPDHHVTQSDAVAIKSIRFLTTDDFPPFHFTLADGTLAGFDIDLARAICTDMKLSCTMQARRFGTLVGEIKAGRNDALIAAVANTAAARADLTFTDPYYTTPARFAVKRDPAPKAGQATGQTAGQSARALAAMTPEALAGHSIGVETDTAHEAYLKTFFPQAKLKAYRNQLDLRAALQMNEVDAIFADGIGLAVWLNGPEGQGCCAFRGGPFTEGRYFGNGVSIAVAKDNVALRQALDVELAKLVSSGAYADIYLKYFPISFY